MSPAKQRSPAELAERISELEDALERQQQLRQDIEQETIPPLFKRLAELEQRVDVLEAENERLRERLESSSHSGKEQKIAAIVEYANQARDGDPAVKLTAKEIKGATGCSTRYAYDLMDDLPQEYEWFLSPQEMLQYGSIEIDNYDARRLGVDFEGVHSTGVPLNKFNNGTSQEEG